MSGAAAVIHKQNKLIELFNRIGAVDAEHAVLLSDINVRRSFVFNRMVERGVFIECENGKFYIDNHMVPVFKEQRRNRAMVVLVVVLVIAAVYFLFGGR